MSATHPDVPADDELVTEILARRRRRTPRLTLALVVLVAAGAAFVGGIEAQKHWGQSPSSGGRGAGADRNADLAALASRFGFSGAGRSGAAGFGAQRAAGFGGGSATVGTVTLIKGSTLYVTDAAGNTVEVHTSPSSRITRTVTGSIRTVLPGQRVTVLGTQAKNGSITASSISVTPGSSSSG